MKFDFFTPRTPPVFGLDVSASSVKMVELSRGKDGIRLERYAVEVASEPLLVEGSVANPDLLSDAISRCYAHFGSKLKHVAIGLPANLVFPRKISVAADIDAAEMEAQILREVENFMPFPISEVNLDYRPLGLSVADPLLQEILIAAARKDKIEERVSAVEAAGLKPLVLDAESYALQEIMERHLAFAGSPVEDRNLAVVDIGALATHVIVFRNNEQIYAREQGIGGGALSGDIMRRYEVSAHDAEQIKAGIKAPPADYAESVLAPFLEGVALEIQRALQLFTTSTAYTSVDALYLTGGCAGLPLISSVIEGVVQTPVAILDPFAGMSHGSAVKKSRLAADAPLLAAACGLALRRFDQ